jgi:hypothetical protein
MRLNEYLQNANENARSMKEHTCADGRADVHPQICVYRGDELIALVTLFHHQRDEILTAASVCAAGFDADVLSLTFETYAADGKIDDPDGGHVNPRTGKQWGPGEMQDAAENHQGIEKGWVTEALLITVANRAGDVVAINQSYRYEGKTLVWQESVLPTMGLAFGLPPSPQLQGLIPDALRQAMNTKSASQVVPGGWDTVDRADRDILTSQLLGKSLTCAVILVADATNDSRVRRLKRAGVTLPPPSA